MSDEHPIPIRVATVLVEINEAKEGRAKLERAVDLLEAELRTLKWNSGPYQDAERRLRETHQLLAAGDSIIAGLRLKLVMTWSELGRPAPCAGRGHEFVRDDDAANRANQARPPNTPALYVEVCVHCDDRRRSTKQRDGTWLVVP